MIDYNDTKTKTVICGVGNLIFHGIDMIVGLLLIIDCILILSRVNEFTLLIFLPIYFMVFGFLICLFVVYVPLKLYVALIFYFNFCGRGITFFFIGCVIITFGDDFSVATGIIYVFVSFIYGIMSIVKKWCGVACSLPPSIIQYKREYPSANTRYRHESVMNSIQYQQDQIWRSYLDKHHNRAPRTIHIFFQFGADHRQTTIAWTYKDAEETYQRNIKKSSNITEEPSSDDDEENNQLQENENQHNELAVDENNQTLSSDCV